MRKYLLIISAMVLSVTSKAQITITAADVPAPGNSFIQATDSFPTIILGSGGANKTWNYASLATDALDTLDFVTPASTPYASQFPSSNVAAYMHGPSGANFLYVINNTSFTLDGFAGDGIVANLNPNELVFNYPATYGTTTSNTSQFDVKLPFTALPGYDSLRVKSTTVKSGVVDAWGSLIIPSGTYNTIRLKETRNVTDSMWVHGTGPFPPAGWYFAQETRDTVYRFQWYANNFGAAILEADSSRADGIQEATFLALFGPTAVPAVASKGLIMYPNPASTLVNFVYEGNNDVLRIYDGSGRLVESLNLTNGVNPVNVENFRAGLYFYSIGNAKAGKFNVVK